MRKSIFTAILSTAFLAVAACLCFAKPVKVIQIFRNGEIIKQYPLDYVDYLEINEIDDETGEIYIPDSPATEMRDAMDKIYTCITTTDPDNKDEIHSSSFFQRTLFFLEELPTDEAKWLWDPALYGLLNYGEVDDSTPILGTAYHKMEAIIKRCNKFINTDFQLEFIEDSAERSKALSMHAEYIRQAKILRSAMYFYLISEFGNVPYCDENTDTAVPAPQLSDEFSKGRRLVTEKVIATLEEIVGWYKDNDPLNRPEYGHVGLDVAEALLVKFYLNHEVFAGSPAWSECLSHAEAIIYRRGNGGFDGSGLAMDYFQNFCQSNRSAADNEIIWRIATVDRKGKPIENYSNGVFMSIAFIPSSSEGYGITLEKSKEYNIVDGWSCMVTTRQLVNVFEWDDDLSVSADPRASRWGTARHGFSPDNPDFSGYNYGKNGFLPVKFTNWNINDDGSIDRSRVPDFKEVYNIDYGMIRLAEIYLSAAEAILHGAGDKQDALRYTNIIRRRARMTPFASIDLPALRAERQRELYTECTRRTDLIRYGLWSSGYDWNWKGLCETGCDYDPNFIVYPLPADVVTNGGYTQNPPCADREYPELTTADVWEAINTDDQYIYLSGSPNGWAEPVMENYQLFKDFRLRKDGNAPVFTGKVQLPPNPEFTLLTSFRKPESGKLGLKTPGGIALDFPNRQSASLAYGGAPVKLTDFAGGTAYMQVDLSDPDNIRLTIGDGDVIFVYGSLINPTTEIFNDWRSPGAENLTFYYDNFRLDKAGEQFYAGQYYISSHSGSQFRFFSDLVNSWGDDLGAGVEADRYVLNVDLTEGKTIKLPMYKNDQSNWGIECDEPTPVTMVVDLKENCLYLRKGFHQVSFDGRIPVFR